MKSDFTSRMLTLNLRNVIAAEKGYRFMKKEEKTNVMRILDQKKIKYVSHCYADTDAISGEEVAADFDTIIFSGGKIGYQVELSLDDLKQVLRFDCEDIIV